MENKINIAEILKNCPTGMELDCVLDDNVTFEGILDGNCYPIKIQTPEGNMQLSQYGCMSLSKHAKCVIFPKGKTTWNGFQRPFMDGDILTNKIGKPFILKAYLPEIDNVWSYCGIDCADKFNKSSNNWTFAKSVRFATEEEKEKLFKAIKDNGYKWNPETKTLEKLVEPKFKVGDRVKHISAYTLGIIVKIADKGYHIDYPKGEGVCYVSFELEKDYDDDLGIVFESAVFDKVKPCRLPFVELSMVFMQSHYRLCIRSSLDIAPQGYCTWDWGFAQNCLLSN